jgi:hypothetical protein
MQSTNRSVTSVFVCLISERKALKENSILLQAGILTCKHKNTYITKYLFSK